MAAPPRDLRLLAGAAFLSATGDLLALVVLGLRMHELTGSGLAVSGVFAASLVPMLALAPIAGLAADRFESVRILALASLAQAVTTIALAFSGEPAAILALALLLAAGNALGQPSEFTLVPAAAGERTLAEAMGVVEGARYAGFAAGPLLAAGLTALGMGPALLGAGVCFAAIAPVALAMTTRRPPPGRRSSKSPCSLDGLRVLRRDAVLRVTIGWVVSALLVISAALTVELFWVKDVVGASGAGYALVLCGWMVGMVLGALRVAPRVPGRFLASAALVALGVQGLGMGAQTAWAILPMAVAGYFVGGLGHGAKNVLLRVLIATRVPEPLHGRAFAAYNAARSTAELAALAAGGALVTAIGPRAALVVAGLGPLMAALAGLVALARVSRAGLGVRASGR